MPTFNRNRTWQIKAVVPQLSRRIINSHRVELTSNEMLELTCPKIEILPCSRSSRGPNQRSWSHSYRRRRVR
jgi:hypothetical protein